MDSFSSSRSLLNPSLSTCTTMSIVEFDESTGALQNNNHNNNIYIQNMDFTQLNKAVSMNSFDHQVPEDSCSPTTRFYIGERIDSSIDIFINQPESDHSLSNSDGISIGQNENTIAMDYAQNDTKKLGSLTVQENELLINAATALMTESANKISEQNSLDSGYGIVTVLNGKEAYLEGNGDIINNNNNDVNMGYNQQRFVACDSSAHILSNQVIMDQTDIESVTQCDSGIHCTDGSGSEWLGKTSSSSGSNGNDCKNGTKVACFTVPSLVKNVGTRLQTSDSLQVLFGVLMSSAGNFFAGLILDRVKNWAVFHQVQQLFYLIPLLLGLKGNLEMTMVARLSTMANTGKIKDWPNTLRIMMRTISLVQCQATLVAIIASSITISMNSFTGTSSASASSVSTEDSLQSGEMIIESGELIKNDFWCRSALIFATSIATANAACFASSILMMLMVVLFSKLQLNPDNFATAIAASFGDVITSGLFGVIGQFIYQQSIYNFKEKLPTDLAIRSMQELQSSTFSIYVILFFVALFPLFVIIAIQDKSSRAVLLSWSAWTPIFVAMTISFVTGWFLQRGASAYAFMALYQPLINGIGGNLAAVSTSRMTTTLHLKMTSGAELDPEKYPIRVGKIIQRVVRSFFCNLKSPDNKFVWIFVLIAIFVQTVWGVPLAYTSEKSENITALFYIFYIFVAATQVLILMILTRFIVHLIWYRGMDPDTCAIPLLTAIGDLLGTVFLLLVFHLLRSMGNSAAVSPTVAVTALTSTDPLHTSTTSAKSIVDIVSQVGGVTYTYLSGDTGEAFTTLMPPQVLAEVDKVPRMIAALTTMATTIATSNY